MPKRKGPSSTAPPSQEAAASSSRPPKRVKSSVKPGSTRPEAESVPPPHPHEPPPSSSAKPVTNKLAPKNAKSKSKPRPLPHKQRKKKLTRLAPVRPFPQVPVGSNATGPYSTRGEGKNRIGVTRQMELAAYLRRCKDLVLKDGYRSIHLTALGAAIAHALLLSTSLPAILSPAFSQSSIKIKTYTSTVQCVDEVLPDESDEDEDEGGMQVRNKSAINIDIIIGDGERVDGTGTGTASGDGRAGKGKQKDVRAKGGANLQTTAQ